MRRDICAALGAESLSGQTPGAIHAVKSVFAAIIGSAEGIALDFKDVTLGIFEILAVGDHRHEFVLAAGERVVPLERLKQSAVGRAGGIGSQSQFLPGLIGRRVDRPIVLAPIGCGAAVGIELRGGLVGIRVQTGRSALTHQQVGKHGHNIGHARISLKLVLDAGGQWVRNMTRPVRHLGHIGDAQGAPPGDHPHPTGIGIEGRLPVSRQPECRWVGIRRPVGGVLPLPAALSAGRGVADRHESASAALFIGLLHAVARGIPHPLLVVDIPVLVDLGIHETAHAGQTIGELRRKSDQHHQQVEREACHFVIKALPGKRMARTATEFILPGQPGQRFRRVTKNLGTLGGGNQLTVVGALDVDP